VFSQRVTVSDVVPHSLLVGAERTGGGGAKLTEVGGVSRSKTAEKNNIITRLVFLAVELKYKNDFLYLVHRTIWC